MLREAGVVDAGGYGLTIIFAGVVAALRGADAAAARAPRAGAHHPPAPPVLDLPLLHELRRHRRRTSSRRPGSSRSSALGDSVLVVGDRHTLKVHVHTDEPERATALFDGAGAVSPARRRRHARAGAASAASALARGGRTTCGVLAVVSGDGHGRAVRRASAPRVLDGGATLNPSTYELLAGIHDGARRAGRRAAELAERPHGRRARRGAVREVGLRRARRARWQPGWPPPSRWTRPRRRRERRRDGARRCTHVRTGGVTEAARDDAQGRFRRGDAVGFVDEQLVAWGEPRRDARGRARRARPRGRAGDA